MHLAFKRLADCFYRFDTVKQTRVKRRLIVNENNTAAILAFFALNPHAKIHIFLMVANFLQNALPQLMEDVPLHVRMNM